MATIRLKMFAIFRLSVYTVRKVAFMPPQGGGKECPMKMILTIVRNEDAPLLLNELNEKKYYVTKLATTGGFLKKGNTTLLMGIEDEQVEEVCEIIRQHSGKRQQIMYTPPAPSNVNVYNSVSSVPVNVEVGGATIFILPVEEERKV